MKVTEHLMKGAKQVDTSVLVLSSILYEANLNDIMRKCMVQMMYAMLVYTPFEAAWARDCRNPSMMMDAFKDLRRKSVKNFLTVILTAIPETVLKGEALRTVITRNIVI